MICNLFSEPTYFLFSTDIPRLLYYTHIPTTIIALLVGFFVFWNGRKLLLNQLLFGISICFAFWTFSNLILWTNIHSDFLLFVWSFLRIFSSIISILCVYFVYVFLEQKDVSNFLKGVFVSLLTPVILFAPTILNLRGFDLTNCDAFMFEGNVFKFFKIGFGIIAMIWIFILLAKKFHSAFSIFRKQILLLGIGIESFLFTFFSVTFFAGYLTDIGVLHDSRIEMYGLFGMIVFMIFISLLIVNFRTFNIGLTLSQALIVSLVILIGSQLTYSNSFENTILISFTLVITGMIGIVLIRSVRKEIKQREEIMRLAVSLQKSNEKLRALDQLKSEFISIASHQLRSPLTAIRGYSSMLAEGSYGKLPVRAQEIAERIVDSTKYMVNSVEDYLSVSRIEAGNMKYELSDFNLKIEAEKLVDDLRQGALKKGIVLVFRSDCEGTCLINADIGKTRQVISNLIDNALKYTKKGEVVVFVHTKMKTKTITVSVKDTGIGMGPETLEEIFDKFVRARNANEVNPTGTGLGLFVAKRMVQAMGGKIWAESEGEGKGSTFHVQFPLR